MVRSKKSGRLSALVFVGVCLTLILSGCNWFKKEEVSGLSREERAKLVNELVRVAHEEGRPGLHAWLKARDPKVVAQAISSLDGTIDRSGNARLDALEAITYLGSDGLPEPVVHEWAELLRKLANETLHAGPERDLFVAKSYKMEGLGDPAKIR